MTDELTSTVQTMRPSPLGNRIRKLTDQLRQENEVQIKATSRILGAAAKIAENHDRLIDQVVEMVEEDLNQPAQMAQSSPYTIEQLKQQFGQLSHAKAHFGVKASGWAGLVDKLNESSLGSAAAVESRSNQPGSKLPSASVSQRLQAIEQEIKALRADMEQGLKLLNLIAEKLL